MSRHPAEAEGRSLTREERDALALAANKDLIPHIYALQWDLICWRSRNLGKPGVDVPAVLPAHLIALACALDLSRYARRRPHWAVIRPVRRLPDGGTMCLPGQMPYGRTRRAWRVECYDRLDVDQPIRHTRSRIRARWWAWRWEQRQ